MRLTALEQKLVGALLVYGAGLAAIGCALVALLLSGCGIPFAQRQGLARGITAWAVDCDKERAKTTQPAPDGPICLAAIRCDNAAGPVITGTAKRKTDLDYANIECSRLSRVSQ